MAKESVRFAHYELRLNPDGSPLEMGRGAMGITYRAFDSKLRVDVVLKIINPALISSERAQRAFLREARAAAKVRHPNIAAVIHLNDTEPVFYTMEFVDGRPLTDLLKAKGRLHPAEAFDYADQIAAALWAMSREKIVHRDLKPANLLLLDDDEQKHGRLVKVIDFGLAKGFSVDGSGAEGFLSSAGLSLDGSFSGTPFYSSPEQCATEGDLDGRSDLYSLGVVLWEMLSGQVPFSGTMGQVLAMHQFKDPPWQQVAEQPKEVIDILHILLAKQKDDRYRTPRELREAIAAILPVISQATIPGSARPGTSTGAGAQTIMPTAPQTVTVGMTLANRYLIELNLGEGAGGWLYKASDTLSAQAVVALKLVRPELCEMAGYIEAFDRHIDGVINCNPGIYLAPLSRMESVDKRVVFLREWASGFSLVDLLRARQRLQATEVLRLLETLPPAVDLAKTNELSLARIFGHKLFVTPSPGVATASDWHSLRGISVTDWPPFILRWNPFSFRTLLGGSLPADMTRAAASTVHDTDNPIKLLGQLIRELVGGDRASQTPLPAFTEAANQLLVRALTRSPAEGGFESAVEFWTQFKEAQLSSGRLRPASSGMQRSPGPPATASPAPLRSTLRPSTARATQPTSASATAPTVPPATVAGEGDAALKFGNYQVQRQPDGSPCLLGRGTFGSTYRAEHIYLRQEVALKVINERFVHDHSTKQRFLREARALHSLRHDNIAVVMDFGDSPSGMYYAMEFCVGGTLDDFVESHGAMPTETVIALAKQGASALAAAHALKFVHRDIKPANIMLASRDEPLRIKLIDFGLVKSLDPLSGSMASTETAGSAGLFTPFFASPEQLREEVLDGRSDLFSFGMTLWYLVAGRLPESGASATIIANRLGPSSYAPLLPSELPAGLREVLGRLLEKEREQRFSSAEELLDALQRLPAPAAPTVIGAPTPLAETADEQAGMATVVAAEIPAALPPVASRYSIGSQLWRHPLGPITQANALDSVEPFLVLQIDEIHRADVAKMEEVTRAAAALSAKTHPGIVRTGPLEPFNDGSIIPMGWIEGPSLLSVLKARRSLPLAEASVILRQVAQAADFAQESGLGHLRLGPSEIFLSGIVSPEGVAPDEILRRAVGDWGDFQAVLLPQIAAGLVEDDTVAVLETPGAPGAEFASLAYHVLSGRSLPFAARVTSSAYSAISLLSEESNRLLQSVACREEDLACGILIERMAAAEMRATADPQSGAATVFADEPVPKPVAPEPEPVLAEQTIISDLIAPAPFVEPDLAEQTIISDLIAPAPFVEFDQLPLPERPATIARVVPEVEVAEQTMIMDPVSVAPTMEPPVAEPDLPEQTIIMDHPAIAPPIKPPEPEPIQSVQPAKPETVQAAAPVFLSTPPASGPRWRLETPKPPVAPAIVEHRPSVPPPKPVPPPFVPVVPAIVPAEHTPAAKSPVLLMAIAAAVVVLAAGIWWLIGSSRGGKTTTTTIAATTPPPVTVPTRSPAVPTAIPVTPAPVVVATPSPIKRPTEFVFDAGLQPPNAVIKINGSVANATRGANRIRVPLTGVTFPAEIVVEAPGFVPMKAFTAQERDIDPKLATLVRLERTQAAFEVIVKGPAADYDQICFQILSALDGEAAFVTEISREAKCFPLRDRATMDARVPTGNYKVLLRSSQTTPAVAAFELEKKVELRTERKFAAVVPESWAGRFLFDFSPAEGVTVTREISIQPGLRPSLVRDTPVVGGKSQPTVEYEAEVTGVNEAGVLSGLIRASRHKDESIRYWDEAFELSREANQIQVRWGWDAPPENQAIDKSVRAALKKQPRYRNGIPEPKTDRSRSQLAVVRKQA